MRTPTKTTLVKEKIEPLIFHVAFRGAGKKQDDDYVAEITDQILAILNDERIKARIEPTFEGFMAWLEKEDI